MSTSTPSPEGLPRFFLDRSMGRLIVPDGLRALGLEVVTLSERYGIDEGQYIDDVVWMPEAAQAGEVALMSDAAIVKKNPVERQVLIESGLRAFVVNAQISGVETIGRFEASLPAIESACEQPGPFVYRLHPQRIERLALRP